MFLVVKFTLRMTVFSDGNPAREAKNHDDDSPLNATANKEAGSMPEREKLLRAHDVLALIAFRATDFLGGSC